MKLRNVMLSVSVLFMASGFSAGNYFYTLALDPRADRSMIFQAPHNRMDAPNEQYDELREWQQSIKLEQEQMLSSDHLNLNAYKIEHPEGSGKWAVIAHGYNAEALSMLEPARHFYEQGYNILLPDARGHGQSDGDYIGMGWPECKDMVQWIEHLTIQQPDAKILLYGVSMGAATMMMTAGEPLPDNVRAVIEDCGYTSVKEEFSYQLKQLFGLPSFPVINFASAVAKVRAGYTLGEADAVRQLKKAKVPILFIHGTEDTFVPYEMLDKVYQAAGSKKEKFAVKGAGHGMAAAVAGDEYWQRVFQFADPLLNRT